MELFYSAQSRSLLPQIIPILKSRSQLKNPKNSIQFHSPIPTKGLNSTVLSMPLKRHSLVLTARASRGGSEISSSVDGRILVGSAITVALAVANRVLYKLALVPMRNYPFFLAQVTTFGYRAGIVTREMVAVPKSRFLVIGLLEALGVVAGMSAGAMLPGPAIPILSQVLLI
ncbi:uncharacterized protein A4U43_C08F11720 [Asparagus officinalis]|nr:uncharacterized protein A4U43_C08F11720 [Asparagus officinalis]